MAKIIFYPVGNGDTSQIVLENGKRLLFDFRHTSTAEQEDTAAIDLKAQLKDELDKAGRDYFDVVAFTHADKDHISKSTEFFELQHAQKYQGEGRIKIKELWVPAAMILEQCTPAQRSDEFVIWRQEARYRLKEGKGIRVFSKPDKLKDWLAENGLSVADRKDLITDAGSLVPSFTLDKDGVEFFCHSPFIRHCDDGDDFRNPASLIFNVRFKAGSVSLDYLAVGDSEWEILEEIVETTQAHNNTDRLEWDLFNVPHHCSYLALSDTKGDEITEPKPKVKELLEMGRRGAQIVSSSKPILDTQEARNQDQPPHIQAKKCYEKYLRAVGGGRIFVTMEEPTQQQPKPLIFNVSDLGIEIDRAIITGVGSVISSTTPRAGK